MLHYNSSILTAQTLVSLLQNDASIQECNIQVKVFDQGINQQGFTLYNQGCDTEYSITEDEVESSILILERIRKGEEYSYTKEHKFDGDYDKAVNWLSKDLQKKFPKWKF